MHEYNLIQAGYRLVERIEPVESIEPDAQTCELTIIIPTFNERENIVALADQLRDSLLGHSWQLIVVDDNSPDGTAEETWRLAEERNNISCIRRLGRRGLAGAVIEGAMASASPFIAVMDGDLQHDSSLLPVMLKQLKSNECDLVIASRFLNSNITEGLSATRNRISLLVNKLVNRVLGTTLSDPLSGYFMIHREIFTRAAPQLYNEGFKILIDLIGTAPAEMSIKEIPLGFGKRIYGNSKLDNKISMDFLTVLLRHLSGLAISPRFIPDLVTSGTAMMVHMASTAAIFLLANPQYGFAAANLGGALIAFAVSCWLGNILDYRDKQRKGWQIFSSCLYNFLLHAPGLVANMAMAMLIFGNGAPWWAAALAGAGMSLCWHMNATVKA